MKKIILSFIASILFFQPICFATEHSATQEITPPTWEDVVVPGADYKYIEPVTFPKWKRPLGHILCFFTLGTINKPLEMDCTINQIAYNNTQFKKLYFRRRKI